MKFTIILNKSVVAALCSIVFIFTSGCKKDITKDSKPTGKLELAVDVSLQINELSSTLKSANAQEFSVVIKDDGGNEVVRFNRYADMPASIELEEGNYIAEANSNNLLPAAFENDYYQGFSENISIQAGQATSSTINCSLANVMITVVYSDDTKSDFTDFQTSVSSATGSLSFISTETRAGYFEARPLSIESTLSYNKGGLPENIKLQGSIPNPEAGKHYEIVIDAKLNNGNLMLNLNVDKSVETETITLTNTDVEAVAPKAGDLIITEVMYDPSQTSDAVGEWFEIYNTTATPIALQGLILRRVSNGDSHSISEDIKLAANSYLVAARSADATSSADYIYGSSISLPNSSDESIALIYNDGSGEVEICKVNYNGAAFPNPPGGSSLQLDPGHLNSVDVIDGTYWCVGTTAFDTGDLGTPGIANTVCP